MGSIFKPKMPAPPPVQPLPETPPAAPGEMSDEEKERISKEQAAIERRRRGRKSTILTSPLGIQESEETKLKTLLGE
jgi:hypothetical protein